MGRSNLEAEPILMHGVAPHMCDKSSATLLGGEAGGRSPGFLLATSLGNITWQLRRGASKGGTFAAAEFPFGADVALSDLDTGLGTGGVADNRASRQRYAKRRLDTGFLRRMGTSLSDRL
jgi:hypothetical protein